MLNRNEGAYQLSPIWSQVISTPMQEWGGWGGGGQQSDFACFRPQLTPTGAYCPFRGCAGDWVKLGVAKRHGAVLGDVV